MRRTFGIVISVIALAISAPLCASDFPEGADKPFTVELGGLWSSFDTTARLDVSRGGIVGLGATLDME